MADVLTEDDLSAYLSIDATQPRPTLVRELVNALITEAWETPADPVPTKVRIMAINVAARALSKVPGRGAVESITRSFDDSTRTERYAVKDEDGRVGEVYLTEDDLAVLNPSGKAAARESIKMRVPGYGTGLPSDF